MLRRLMGAALLPGTSRAGLAGCGRLLQRRGMFIQVSDTPNPLTLKFMPGREVAGPGRTFEFTSVRSAKHSPLALALLRIEGVKAVMLGDEFVTVTKNDESVDWSLVQPHVFATIMDLLQSNRPAVDEQALEQSSSSSAAQVEAEEEEDDTVIMIKDLIDSRIRPTVQGDGGDVEYRGFRDGTVFLKMKGSCTGCPSSAVTLQAGIKNMLSFYVPEVKDVVEVKDEDDDLVQREVDKLDAKLDKH